MPKAKAELKKGGADKKGPLAAPAARGAGRAAAPPRAGAAPKGMLLAETWDKVDPQPDPTGWWVSEKLDGVRAYWNGAALYSRNGNRFKCPTFFTEGLPRDSHLDGELWCGKEQFERAVGIVKGHKRQDGGGKYGEEDWRSLRFVAFDAPVVRGEAGLPYERRRGFCERALHGAPHAQAIAVRACGGRGELDAMLRAALSCGAEGLMLREPGSVYERRRSRTLLKVKAFRDMEARVVGHKDGKGNNADALGSLTCELASGVRFELGGGFTAAQRVWASAKRRWPAGRVVTFKYQNLTAKGAPRFPIYLRDRADKTWAEVVADHNEDAKRGGASGARSAVGRAPSFLQRAPA